MVPHRPSYLAARRELIDRLSEGGRSALRAAFVRESVRESNASDGRWLQWSADPAGCLESRSPARLATRSLGLEPAFVLVDAATNEIVAASDHCELLAALGDCRADANALAESLLFGFMIGPSSRFERVRRLLPRERFEIDEEGQGRLVQTGKAHPPVALADAEARLRSELAPQVAEAFEAGAAMELSGGYDSRLSLALGLAGGEKPRLAFTLGEPDSPDVRSAAAICEAFDIRHVVLKAVGDGGSDDVADIVQASGYQVNAASYGWLPGVFRQLKSLRDSQIGGSGGECATGFYYTRFDPILDRGLLRREWVNLRLRIPSRAIDRLYASRSAGESPAAAAVDHALRLLNEGDAGQSWRERVDRFYREQRVRQWGSPVLVASQHWYEPVAPLLSDAYIQWSLSLPVPERTRASQHRLIASLSPKLAALPYAHAFGRKSGTLTKVTRRLVRSRRAADLGAAAVAERLAGDEAVRALLLELVQTPHLGLNAANAQALLCSPAEAPRELGALVSAAMALRAADRWRSQLSCPSRAAG